MLRRIHVNQHIIKKNKKCDERNPVLTCKSYKDNVKGNKVAILDSAGNVVANVIYSPDKPLSCGATCWVETKNEVVVT